MPLNLTRVVNEDEGKGMVVVEETMWRDFGDGGASAIRATWCWHVNNIV